MSDEKIVTTDNQEGTENKETNKDLQLLLGAKFTLLGKKLTAAYRKEQDGYTVLLAPNTEYDEKNQGITITEMIKQVNELVGKIDSNAETLNEKDVEDKISETNSSAASGGKFDIKKLRVILETAYLYIHSDKQGKTIEYAFSLVIDAKDVIPEDINFVNVESVTLAVWSTKRDKILKTMSIFNPDTYIEG